MPKRGSADLRKARVKISNARKRTVEKRKLEDEKRQKAVQDLARKNLITAFFISIPVTWLIGHFIVAPILLLFRDRVTFWDYLILFFLVFLSIHAGLVQGEAYSSIVYKK